MKPVVAYGGYAALAFSLVVLSSRAAMSTGQSGALVRLQPTTPGSAQTGNLNISGTAIAGQFQGGGAGVTGLNATNLTTGTLDPARLPVPLALSGAGANWILKGSNSSASNGGAAVAGEITGGTGSSYAVYGLNSTSSGLGVFGWASATAGPNAGVAGQADGDFGLGLYGVATSQTGTVRGVYGVANGASGRGVEGQGGSIGVYGNTSSTSGIGVAGASSATTGASYGVYGTSASGSGYGVYGTNSSTGYGGFFTTTNPQGVALGARQTQASASAWAFYATSSSSLDNYNAMQCTLDSSTPGYASNAIYGKSLGFGGNGCGVFGESWGYSIGVRGQSSSGGAGVSGGVQDLNANGYGVRGYCGANGYGVYATGRMGASGTKSFRIDHPLDPENKYLYHYCTEGPEPLNVYSGTVVTAPDGWATVSLPDYFSEINRDPRVQLTVDDSGDDFVQVKVVGGVQGNAFRIRTSRGGVKVYWEVKAVRNDLYVRKYGAPVEETKPEHERGTYQHPELYGMPESMGTFDRKTGGYSQRALNGGKP